MLYITSKACRSFRLAPSISVWARDLKGTTTNQIRPQLTHRRHFTYSDTAEYFEPDPYEEEEKISVYNNIPIPTWAIKPYSNVPALGDLPEIVHNREPVIEKGEFVVLRPWHTDYTNRKEGCFVTKEMNYGNQLGYWLNPVADSKIKKKIQGTLESMNILPHMYADLEWEYNRSFFSPSIQSAMDDFGFIAVTASSSTLDLLIPMIKSENIRRQAEVNKAGSAELRKIDYSHPGVSDPEFQLVAMHPHHFLPRGCQLSIFDPKTQTYTTYVAATDGHIRESVDSWSPRLPCFERNDKNRPSKKYSLMQANVFFVVLGADIKFRRYFKWADANPASEQQLPEDVVTLMRRTMELAALLYQRDPVPEDGSDGFNRLPYYAIYENCEESEF
ncbi:hypothetical protein GALMADRAFT_136342 [Galerina marginata CBS 339.88]|uniref:Uncharacterized protein n=1 Tax=Galerina marginata (strain CBS 339.88) TaxID=685588 RepID=A0A067T998_GALM3|nr:hypothetical protein GALMADRAFT_136342 [Galerina marginata CBS 339.88]